MNPNEYQDRALAKEADQVELLQWLEAMTIEEKVKALRLSNGVRGLTDEVGELASAAKKWLEYRKSLDKENVLEECGDALWRIAQILRSVDYTMQEAMVSNLNKLEKVRYKNTICNPVDAAEENRDRNAEAVAIRAQLRAEDDGPNYEEGN